MEEISGFFGVETGPWTHELSAARSGADFAFLFAGGRSFQTKFGRDICAQALAVPADCAVVEALTGVSTR